MSLSSAEPSTAMAARDAELLFRTKKIPEIRTVESATSQEIEQKKEELRQLVGKSYRDLIDSADTILLMNTSCQSISSNLNAIETSIRSLSDLAESGSPLRDAGIADPGRIRVYGIASRVKYLVDTSENIWGCLDESMFLEASGRYLRASAVHGLIKDSKDEVISKFPLLRQIWANVESLKGQISRRSRERLIDQGLSIDAYANALAAVAVIDNQDPKAALSIFLDSRRSWIWQKIGGSFTADRDHLFSTISAVVRIVRSTLGQVGELFLQVSNDLPLFYKTVLGTPPGSQLFGGIPNPEKEVKQWKMHRDNLESIMESLDSSYVTESCSLWLRKCCSDIFGSGSGKKNLIDGFVRGEELAFAEKIIRESLNCREDLESTLELWLKNALGSEVESPWDLIRGVILKDQRDILENALEDALVRKMKDIVNQGFEEISGNIDLKKSVQSIGVKNEEEDDFRAYLDRPSTGGGIWFKFSEVNLRKAGVVLGMKQTNDDSDFNYSLNVYLGSEVSAIKDNLDTKCGFILEDLLSFIDSYNSETRLKELAPFLQQKCFSTISAFLKVAEDELKELSTLLVDNSVVRRALFIGRLLFAIRNHSSQLSLLLGSPRKWVKETGSSGFGFKHSTMGINSTVPQSPKIRRNENALSPRRQKISLAAALFPLDDSMKDKLDALMKSMRDLCVKAHSLWVSWVSDGLSSILFEDLRKDDALSLRTSLPGWEVMTINQEESTEGSQEMQVSLPSMPSAYVISYLFQACREVHSVGGHVLDKTTLQNFAWELLRKVLSLYGKFSSSAGRDGFPEISEKGALQMLFDIKFAADVLSGGKYDRSDGQEEGQSKGKIIRPSFRQSQSKLQPKSAASERLMSLISSLSQILDPIDWATYEPFLWENEKQSYKRYAVLFGFFVQLNRMHADVVQKLPTRSNTESNILRGYPVPRFKYLPISGPLQTSKGTARSQLAGFSEDSLRGSRQAYYANGVRSSTSAEFDESLGFAAATPLFKSFMTQVGSKFGESTSRLGEMLPGPAVGLLSSFSTGAARSEA
ncbi:vps51/Vps67 family (components of vesicular transport) protein [Wolffia australiana]